MKKLLSLTLILILSAGFLGSCKKDKGEPPNLPPLGSMSIDFSNFITSSKSSGFLSEAKGINESNWEFSAAVAHIWSDIIVSILIVPVTSFKLAIDQDPEYLEEKTWQWNYSATVASNAYTAKLTGQISTNDVLWKMYITKGTEFTDFLWFEGTSKLDGTGGQWILNESPQSPGAMLQIDWTSTGTSVGTVKYTYVKNGDPFKNSYIEYGLTSDDLNAYYTIHYYNSNLQAFSDVNVEWNTTTYNGRVKCFDYLGNDNWYCWDANKINIICP